MGNTESRETDAAPGSFIHTHTASNKPSPPTPKHLLWGCATAAEHWEFLKRVSSLSSTAHCQGAAGLQALGLEYRWVHSAKNCRCDEQQDNDEMGLLQTERSSSNNNNENTNRNQQPAIQQDETKDEWYHEEDINVVDDNNNNDEDHVPSEFMVPIGESIEKHRKSLRTLQIDDDFLHEYRTNHVDDDDDDEDEALSNNRSPFRRSSSSKQLHRKMSTVSLFSLATHSSKSSTATLSQLDDDFPENEDDDDDEQQEECSWRLYHIASDTLITEQNHRSFIAHGVMYDTVARLCMEHAQDMMQQAGNLEWVQIPCSPHTHTGSDGDRDKNDSVGALVSRGYLLEDSNKNGSGRPTLLILTGTGQVQAGIFSRRHLMTSSIEAASALPFIRQAVVRDMDIVLLDPNCQGPQKAMEVVERSLDELWFGVSQQKKGGNGMNTHVFVLAHSMGGSQIVRYLLKKTTDTNMNDSKNEVTIMNAAAMLDQIKSLAFTDSNHNINWTKNNSALTKLLVDGRSIYIKSHKTHEKAKARGEAVDDCHFWRHRFGTIKTLWAGTHEHALTNYTARWQIWNHFDSFLVPSSHDEQEGGNEEEDALSF